MATASATKISTEEFLRMDFGEGPHELVRGEIITMSPAGPAHGYLCFNVGAILRDFGRRTGHGYAVGNDSTIIISDETVRGADAAYYSEARWPRARLAEGYAAVPPDLAVEVYSPSNRPAEMLRKVGDYLSAGVLVVWVPHPTRRTLTVYRREDPTPTVLTEIDTLDGHPELPGFRCDVAEFFD